MEELLQIMKALSDEIRLKIVKLLEGGELCVCDIVAALDMVQPKVSFHLAALKEAGLIRDRKEGKWTHYSLSDADMFRRFLLSAILEKMPEVELSKEKSRLVNFMKNKGAKKISFIKERKRNCCGK